jgi:ferredoxin--NADP+ reductase
MSRIIRKTELTRGIFELLIEAPALAAKARPGHFVVVMADAQGERVPLTIADYDPQEGTITLVLAVVGASSRKLADLDEGAPLYALLGPLGHPSKLISSGAAILVAGGVGTAPIYPIARALRQQGVRVVAIQGARSASLLFWRDKLAAVCDRHIVVTDDGSQGRKGLVTAPLRELIEADPHRIGCVYAIGPGVMMKACAETTRPFAVPTVVSLNTIMVDGTGMCGGCRIRLGKQTLFTCVDGPEFDGHLVDWETVLHRQKIYVAEERCSLDRYVAESECGGSNSPV